MSRGKLACHGLTTRIAEAAVARLTGALVPGEKETQLKPKLTGEDVAFAPSFPDGVLPLIAATNLTPNTLAFERAGYKGTGRRPASESVYGA